MVSTASVPEKVAWVVLRGNRVLVTRNHGRDLFYFPGGKRELGESDSATLVREIAEELQATILAETMRHFGTYETGSAAGGPAEFRMICYDAEHQGTLNPAREIAEMAWFAYADRPRVSPADQLVFDALHAAGRLA